ncbi:MAG: hypothetical protein QXE22_01900 [Candidatus Bathyarchaeia archaeon]
MGRKEGVTLRVMGATAIKIHCPTFSSLQESLGREISDVDFMAYSSQKDEVMRLLLRLGYNFDRRSLMIMRYFNRYIFEDVENKRHVDVFFDKLEMCHTIDFKERLEVDYPTISLADLLLEKLQIIKVAEKDLKDCIVLLREHNVGEHDEETINIKYISNLLSKDWGFYYTVKMNLERIKNFLNSHPTLKASDKSNILQKISLLETEIENAPKSIRWKMRAKVGPKQKWYREVEEVER